MPFYNKFSIIKRCAIYNILIFIENFYYAVFEIFDNPSDDKSLLFMF